MPVTIISQSPASGLVTVIPSRLFVSPFSSPQTFPEGSLSTKSKSLTKHWVAQDVTAIFGLSVHERTTLNSGVPIGIVNLIDFVSDVSISKRSINELLIA